MTEGDDRETAERTGTVKTVLFADIADSSRILVEGGDANAHTVVRSCIETMMEAAAKQDGMVVSEKGDDILCIFEDPSHASAAASDMQHRISNLSADHPEFPRIALRIGFEQGPLIQTEEGVFGTTVYSAARLVSLAKAGQILSTKETIGAISGDEPVETRFFGRQVLRGQPQEREISEILWDIGDRTDRTTFLPPLSETLGARIEQIEVTHDGRDYVIDATSPRLDLGRNQLCDVPVKHESVSRLHARISWNSGRAQVEDMSTNGTLVEPRDAESIALHHEKARLRGVGVLRLGSLTPGDDGAPQVGYRCVASKDRTRGK